ncbi:MAG: hypothetical protein AB4290_22075 [Spirulina sp.]
MNIIRWLLSILIALILAITLILSLPTTAFVQQITDSQTVKTWLRESNFYEDFLAAAFRELARDIFPSTENIPLVSDRQAIEEVQNSLPDRFIQNSFETIIDAYYNYFHGRQDRIEFTISLVEIEENLKTNVPKLLKETIAALPPCPGNTQQDYEKFERGECLPSEANKRELYQAIDNTLQNGEKIFEKPNLTEEDLNINYQNLQQGRQFFAIAKAIPFTSYGVLLLFSLIILILTPRPIKKGLLVLGITWIPTTFFVGAIALTSQSNVLAFIQGSIQESPENSDLIVNTLLFNFLETAYRSLSDRILLLSGVGFVFGIACMILSAIRFRAVD